jgi:hypothetical protein
MLSIIYTDKVSWSNALFGRTNCLIAPSSRDGGCALSGNGETSLRSGLKDRASGGAPISLRAIVDGLKLSYPVSCKMLLDLLVPIDLKFSLNAGSVSGSCELTMVSNGFLRYHGSVHNNGLASAKYGAVTSIQNAIWDPNFPSNVPLLLEHVGEVAGTFGFGSKDDSWDNSLTYQKIADNWTALKNAVGTANTSFSAASDITEFLEAAASAGTGAFVLNL